MFFLFNFSKLTNDKTVNMKEPNSIHCVNSMFKTKFKKRVKITSYTMHNEPMI